MNLMDLHTKLLQTTLRIWTLPASFAKDMMMAPGTPIQGATTFWHVQRILEDFRDLAEGK